MQSSVILFTAIMEAYRNCRELISWPYQRQKYQLRN